MGGSINLDVGVKAKWATATGRRPQPTPHIANRTFALGTVVRAAPEPVSNSRLRFIELMRESPRSHPLRSADPQAP
ncbi:hypothetical protein GCM10009566_62840 [Streptomyces murinus]